MHELPDFAYFDHSIHLAKGVGCTTCHGPVDQMPLTWRYASLDMQWCLDCHRAPERYLRPLDRVFDVDWTPPPDQTSAGMRLASDLSPARYARADGLLDMPSMNHDAPHPSPSAGVEPPRFWRSIDERSRLRPSGASVGGAPVTMSRRSFLQWLAASMALAGNGCTRPPREKIVPYIHGPAQSSYGKPVYYASAHLRDGYASGILVATQMGRPTKIEGNPRHPASLGATDIFAQASVLDLWDPQRLQTVRRRSRPDTWSAFTTALETRVGDAAKGGEGLHLLTEVVISPTLHAQITALRQRFPAMRWHQYQPFDRANVYEGSRLAFGAPLETHYRVDRARVVVDLAADILTALPGSTRYAHDFAARRRKAEGHGATRLFAAEILPSLTGAIADRRIAVRPSEMEILARALAASVGAIAETAFAPAWPSQWVNEAAQALRDHAGAGLVVAGDAQAPIVHALAHATNARLSNLGATALQTDPVAAEPAGIDPSLHDLRDAMRRAEVTTLLIIDGNPAYSLPADTEFAKALASVPFAAHLTTYENETSSLCEWRLPLAHGLEGWGDARAFDGTASIIQPCIAPLHDGRSALELLGSLSADPLADAASSAYEMVRRTWRERLGTAHFDRDWEGALHDGVVAGSALAVGTPALRAIDLPPRAVGTASDTIELAFAPDPTIGDGRHAHNAWLQELPKPISKLTWSNALMLSPGLATHLGVSNEDELEMTLDGSTLRAPAWIQPGQNDKVVGLHLGYGRALGGTLGVDEGVNTNTLRSTRNAWHAPDVVLRKTGVRRALASTQSHATMEGRDIVRVVERSEALRAGSGIPRGAAASLYPDMRESEYAWAMSIDLDSCIGCGACTIACQAENNIPVVGKDEVRLGREMHWIRVDRYYEGEPAAPRTLFMPVPCMQCEHAPCEVVCPVEASVHDSEGLNVQVYNRCVGTRFCSNNCPYKVRRFNFLQYSRDDPLLNAQRNPEVTVRMRGVMEKCTYCVQRIGAARSVADGEGRRIRDGEVVTACQAVCPTQAIVFGDRNDPASAVSARKASPLDYALLGELNTRPRTTYAPRLVDDAATSDYTAPTRG